MCSTHAQVHALDVDPLDAIEILLRGRRQAAHVRDARVVHQDVHAPLFNDLAEDRAYACGVRHVARVCLRLSSRRIDFLRRGFRRAAVAIQNVYGRSLAGKRVCNGQTDTAGRSGDDSTIALQ
jgi:hypothetical protein